MNRVVIVSGRPLFREGITRLLEDQAEVVGTVADWEEARALIQRWRVEAIVVDHEGADLKETDLAPLLWSEMEALKVIYVTLAGSEMIVHHRSQITDVTDADLLCALQSGCLESDKG